jgi:TonB-dependent starch-binding outer membrane protein SusC
MNHQITKLNESFKFNKPFNNMKNNLQKIIYMLSKFFLYGFIVQLLVFNFCFATNANGQYKSIDEVSVNIQKQSLNLGQFFKLIEGQTQFKFSFDKRDVDASSPVILTQKSGTVEEFLKQAAVQTSLSFRQINNNIDVRKVTSPQPVVTEEPMEVTITGTVYDDLGEPLPGVTILLEGKGTGTVTDIDGKYSIVADEGDVLVFSFVGFVKQSVVVGTTTEININLVQDVDSWKNLLWLDMEP